MRGKKKIISEFRRNFYRGFAGFTLNKGDKGYFITHGPTPQNGPNQTESEYRTPSGMDHPSTGISRKNLSKALTQIAYLKK